MVPRAHGDEPYSDSQHRADSEEAPSGRGWTITGHHQRRLVGGSPVRMGISRVKRYVAQRSFPIEQKKRTTPARNKQTAKPPRSKRHNNPTPTPKPRVRHEAATEIQREEKPGAILQEQVNPTTQTKAALTREVKKTPTKREEYDRARSQTPERREYRRQHQRKVDKIAKETSKCVSCPNPAIKDQTRCETCAERHREYRRRSDARRQDIASQTATTDQ